MRKNWMVLVSLMTLSSAAQAHVTLEQQEAMIGGGYRATFRVPHGCGESATTKLRIQLPAGVVGVKPMPKAGWQLDLVTGKYDKSYAVYHGSVTEGVKEVSWSGRLPDAHYDEFVLSVYLTDDLAPVRTLYFPVVQECENGVSRWIEIPRDGQSASDLKQPAPGVKLLPRK